MTGQIDLWPIALPQPGDDSFGNRMMVCERRLSNDERIRAKRYEPRRRAEFVITRGTMREILQRYAEQQTSRLVFQVGPKLLYSEQYSEWLPRKAAVCQPGRRRPRWLG